MAVRSVRDLCLMEIAAALAGEPGTDHPSCVHPVLAAVARAVYDQTSTSSRDALRMLAPKMIVTSRCGLEMSAQLVATCVSTALASPEPGRITADERRRLAVAADIAQYLMDRCGGAAVRDRAGRVATLRGAARWWVRGLDRVSLTESFYRRVVAPEAAAEAVMVVSRASGAAKDRRLRQLLWWCLAVTSPSREATQENIPTVRVVRFPARKDLR